MHISFVLFLVCTELQTELIREYKDVIKSVNVLPFEDSPGLPLTELFAPILLEEDLSAHAKPFSANENEISGKIIENLTDLFNIEERETRRIFMKGEAGYGKTFFCLKLLNVWCEAKELSLTKNASKSRNVFFKKVLKLGRKVRDFFHPESNRLNAGDMNHQCLNVFDIAFYVPMRQVTARTSLVDMICDIVSQDDPKMIQKVKLLLSSRSIRCLILLDGLDEWPQPTGIRGLPDMHGIANCVLLCTMRPWKMVTLQLKFTPDDKLVQILGLDADRIPEVMSKVLVNYCGVLPDSPELTAKVEKYCIKIQQSQLETLVKIPMIVTALCYIWHEEDVQSERNVHKGIELKNTDNMAISENSLTLTYLKLIEAMIRRADEKHDLRSFFDQRNVPKIFSDFRYISNLMDVLLKFCELAYTDLVSNETKLVFQKEQLEMKIGVEQVQAVLRIGLISQTRAPGKFHQQNISVNFYHKTIQEFMAAMYLTFDGTNFSSFCEYCSSVEKVMELTNIITFAAGLDPHLGWRLSKHVADIIDHDTDMIDYRETCNDNYAYADRTGILYMTQCKWYRELLHNMAVTGEKDTSPTIHVSDIFLFRDSDEDLIHLTEKMMQSNLDNIVSVSLYGTTVGSVRNVIRLLPHCTRLSALHVRYIDSQEDKDLLFNVLPQLKHLETILYDCTFGDVWITCNEFKAMFQLTQLRCIYFIGVRIRFNTTESFALLCNMTKLQKLVFSDAGIIRAPFDKMFSSLSTLQQTVRLELIRTLIDHDRNSIYVLEMIHNSYACEVSVHPDQCKTDEHAIQIHTRFVFNREAGNI